MNIKTRVLGDKKFRISWTFKDHIAFGGDPKNKRPDIKRYAGIDIATPVGTNIYAPENGVVKKAYKDGNGAIILILTHKKCETQYAHLLAYLVETGDKVKAGRLIGRTGATGKVRPHLHFGLIKGGKRIDPYEYLVVTPKPKVITTRPLEAPKQPLPAVLPAQLTPSTYFRAIMEVTPFMMDRILVLLTRLWDFLDGYKTYIGGAILFVSGGLRALKVIDEETYLFIMAAGATITTVGFRMAIGKLLSK